MVKDKMGWICRKGFEIQPRLTLELLRGQSGLYHLIPTVYARQISTDSTKVEFRKASELPNQSILSFRCSKVDYTSVSNASSNVLQTVNGNSFAANSLHWKNKPKNILIVKRVGDIRSDEPLKQLIGWLQRDHSDINIVLEYEVQKEYKFKNVYVINHLSDTQASEQQQNKDITKSQDYENQYDNYSDYCNKIDFIISLGGDGTLVHASSLFPWLCPPVIPFSLGTVGFLLPFQFNDYKTIIQNVLSGDAPLLMRMRLQCQIKKIDSNTNFNDGKLVSISNSKMQAMNEITVHRGRNTHLTALDCYVNDEYLTDAVADGLIVATPTGSTAYSLSAGGPIVHPSVQSILMTPICPRSLSFRPALLPPSSVIGFQLGSHSRGNAELSIDGHSTRTLNKDERVEISVSPYPLPCISAYGEVWLKDVNKTLKWNQGFVSGNILTHVPID